MSASQRTSSRPRCCDQWPWQFDHFSFHLFLVLFPWWSSPSLCPSLCVIQFFFLTTPSCMCVCVWCVWGRERESGRAQTASLLTCWSELGVLQPPSLGMFPALKNQTFYVCFFNPRGHRVVKEPTTCRNNKYINTHSDWVTGRWQFIHSVINIKHVNVFTDIVDSTFIYWRENTNITS